MDAAPRKRRRHRFGAWRRDRGFLMRLVLHVVALVSILLGVIGWILPVMPGWPFFIAGVVILAGVNRWVRGFLHRFLNRHPRLDSGYLRIRAALSKKKQPTAPGVAAGPPTAT